MKTGAATGEMPMSQAKSYLRKILLHRRRLLSSLFRRKASGKVCARVTGMPEFKRTKCVLGYWTAGSEVDTWPIIRRAVALGKTVALPCSGPSKIVSWKPGDALVIGKWGIPEPAGGSAMALKDIDFALVPGLGFDMDGNRLGRGKGFYDVFLKRFRGLACGIAFETQHVGWIPVSKHDAKIHVLATEKAIHRYGGSNGDASSVSGRTCRGNRSRVRGTASLRTHTTALGGKPGAARAAGGKIQG